jgi:glycine cleavage system H protein
MFSRKKKLKIYNILKIRYKMNFKTTLNLTPFGDVKCIWMSTGIVDYKLCENNSDCDNCEFYKKMRATFSEEYIYGYEQMPKAEEILNSDGYRKIIHSIVNNYKFKNDYSYYSKNLWIKTTNNKEVKIGINSFLGNLLPKNVSVVMPVVGNVVKQGHPVFWLNSGNNIITVKSPLSGIVKSVNSKLIDFPNQISDDNSELSWIFTLKTTNIEKEKNRLYSYKEITTSVAKDAEKLENRLLESIMSSYSGAGSTMADGGIINSNLCDIFGESRYLELINSLFY